MELRLQTSSCGVSGQRPVVGRLLGGEEELSAVSRAARPNVLSLQRGSTWDLCSGH